MNNMDEIYYTNIRNTLVFREGTVRIDADGNLLSLAVLSEGFYCALLNTLMGWNLINANSEEKNSPGIDLIDRDRKIALQVSLTCDHEKVQRSIDKFKADSYGGWHFYFVPIKRDTPYFRVDFSLPEGLIFDKTKDVLSVSRILRIVQQERSIDKLRELSLLMDKYTKELPDHEALCKRLYNRLSETRDHHPSFLLMGEDGIDKHLFPHTNELIPVMGNVNGSVAPIWDHIKAEHKESFRHVIIEGDGGIGKSISLLSITEDNELLVRIPAIYIHIYDLVYSGKCLTLPEYLAHNADNVEIDELCREAGEPKLMLLLDGLNEVAYEYQDEILRSIKIWTAGHKGAQLIMASRSIPGKQLNRLLGGNVLHISLVGLKKERARERLISWGIHIPDENASIWDTLKLPLFLTLFAKTANLPNETSNGYPLDICKSVGQATLIWNYLQREILRKDESSWPMKCAIACEWVAPYIAYKMVMKNSFEIGRDEAEDFVGEAIKSINMNALPIHLTKMNRHRRHRRSALPEEDWESLVLDESGILVTSKNGANNGNADNDAYSFIHQNFRDCLAGLYIFNMAQVADSKLPYVWKCSVRKDIIKHAAELMDEETARKIWDLNKSEMLYKEGKVNSATSTLIQLELNSQLLHKTPELDFSGMDLRNVSLTRYMGLGQKRLDLFHKPKLSCGTRLNKQTFQSAGHRGSVSGLAVMSNRQIVSVSQDNTLRIWNISTGECYRIIFGHTNWVRCVVSLTDNRIVSGSDDKTLCVWDGDTGKLIRMLIGHSDWIRCIAVLSDGLIASGSYDRTVRVWDIKQGKCVMILEGHTDWVRCVVEISNRRLASGSQDGIIRIWDVDLGECINTIKGHTDCVRCIAMLNNQHIVTGSYDETLRVWDSITGECLGTLVGHTGSVNCITTLPNGFIVSGSDDKTIRIWDVSSGNCVKTIPNQESPVASVAAVSGELIAVGLDNGILKILDTYSGECVTTFEEHHGCIRCLASFSDGRLICGAADNTFRIWDPNTQKTITINNAPFEAIQCIATLPNGIIAVGSNDSSIYIWNANTGRILKKLVGHSDLIRCLAALPNNMVISGARDNTLRIWNIEEGICTKVLEGHAGSVECVAVLPNGNIVSGSNDRTILEWDKDTFKPYRVIDGNEVVATALTALQSGQIAIGRTDGRICIFNPNNGKCTMTLKGHTDAVTCVTTLHNGNIASGSYDNTIRIWNPNTGECVDKLETTEVDVSGLYFTEAIITDKAKALLQQNGAIIIDNKADSEHPVCGSSNILRCHSQADVYKEAEVDLQKAVIEPNSGEG